MGWEVNNLTLGGGPGIIMEEVTDIQNNIGEVVSGSDSNNDMDRRC